VGSPKKFDNLWLHMHGMLNIIINLIFCF
jgi:hypothetical protein